MASTDKGNDAEEKGTLKQNWFKKNGEKGQTGGCSRNFISQ